MARSTQLVFGGAFLLVFGAASGQAMGRSATGKYAEIEQKVSPTPSPSSGYSPEQERSPSFSSSAGSSPENSPPFSSSSSGSSPEQERPASRCCGSHRVRYACLGSSADMLFDESLQGVRMTVAVCEYGCTSQNFQRSQPRDQDRNSISTPSPTSQASPTADNRTFFALKNGNECWCGKSNDNLFTNLDSHVVADEHCNTTCSAGDGDSCGGTDFFEVFYTE